jgi:hypothetical protein
MQRIRWMQQSSIIEVILQGLKPASLAVRSAEAKASAYLEARATARTNPKGFGQVSW